MITPTETVAVSVKPDNSLLVTIGVDYNSDGQISGSEITSQYTLAPGDSLEGQPEQVVKIANALWTPAVIEAYKLANPPSPEPVSVIEDDPAPSEKAPYVNPVDPFKLPTSDVPSSVDGMSFKILG